MPARPLLILTIAAVLVAASGCDRPGARGRGLRITAAGAGAPLAAGVVSNAGAGVISNGGGGVISTGGGAVVSTNGGSVVSTNGAALAGVVRGPSAAVVSNHAAGVLANHGGSLLGNNAAALVANNAAGLVGNNAGGLVGNNAGGLVGNNVGAYRLAHAGEHAPPAGRGASRLAAVGLVPLAGARVEAFDLAGKLVSRAPVRSGPDGAFVFEPGALGPSSGPLVFRAQVEVGPRTLTLEALVPRGAAGAGKAIALSPASTLVAKKARALAQAGALPGSLGVDAAEALAEALAPFMSERAAVAAVLVEPALASQVLDAMAKASPALASELDEAGASSAGAGLLAPTPSDAGTAPAPTATPRRGGGGSGGSGGGSGPTPEPTATPPADLAPGVATADFLVASRIAGTGAHGSAAGTNPLTATIGEIGGVAVAPDGSVYFTDVDHHQIRRRKDASAPLELVAGAGDEGPGFEGDGLPATRARLSYPLGLAFDGVRDVLVFADHDNNRIRAFAPGGRIGTLVGGGEDAGDEVASPLDAKLDGPAAIALDPTGYLFFTEHGRVRRMAPDGAIATLVGILSGAEHWALANDPARDVVWYADGAEVCLLQNARTTGTQLPSIVFTATGEGPDVPRVVGLATDRRGRLYVLQAGQDGGQPRDVKLFRIRVDQDGLPLGAPELLAGTGALGASSGAYLLPAPGTGNALGQLLPGNGGCGLAIDLNHAASQTTLGGQLYLGGNAEASGETGGQLIRFDPIDTGAVAN